MFIEIVHVNGRYSPEARSHTPPPGASEVLPRLHAVTESAIAAGLDVLYKPNLNGNVGKIAIDPMARFFASISDPYLSGLSKLTRDKVTVRFDGVVTPPDYANETYSIEDALARKHKRGYVLGAFTSACVLYTAQTIMIRNPGVLMGIDTSLCVNWPGETDNYVSMDAGEVVLSELELPSPSTKSK